MLLKSVAHTAYFD